MKRFLTAALCVILVSSPVLALEGGGSAEAPYLIQNLMDFQEFCADSSYWGAGIHTRLTTSLDLTGLFYTEAPIAPGTGGRYMGYFDGYSQTISNLTVSGTAGYLGLFGRIGNGSTVANLTMENVNIATSATYIGGLCGKNEYGTVANCKVTGSVRGTGTSYSYIGGICGSSDHGTITGCSSAATVNGKSYAGGICSMNYIGTISNCSVTGPVTGYNYTGGICGENSQTIENCYTTGSINGWADTGGICGMNQGTVTNCYARGSVRGTTQLGGICGQSSYGGVTENCYSTGSVRSGSGQYDYIGGICGSLTSATVTNCFWDTQTSGNSTSAGGTGLLTSDMQTLDTYTPEWDFTRADGNSALWFLPDNDYPKLFIQPNMNWDGPTDIALPLDEQTAIPVDLHTWLDAAVTWTIMDDPACPWITSIIADNGISTGPADITTVTMNVDATGLGVGDYTYDLMLGTNIGDTTLVPMTLHVFNRVDAGEIALLGQYWQMAGCDKTQPCSAADWFIDGKIDILDLNQLAMNWLGEEMAYAYGEITDSFESGDFTALNWSFGGDGDWVIVSDTASEGSFSAKSGSIDYNQTSSMELTVDVGERDRISFNYKVVGDNYMYFYLDDDEMDSWSGYEQWQLQEYTITPGVHTFKWFYDKDEEDNDSTSSWVDNIRIYKAE